MNCLHCGSAPRAHADVSARALHGILATSVVALLTACGGGADPAPSAAAQPQARASGFERAQAESAITYAADGTAQICGNHATYRTPVGELVNDQWNAGGVNGWQCIQGRWTSSGWEYGWTWSWPMASGMYSYPHVRWGVSPWTGGPSNDTRFPRAISATPRMNVSYDLTTTGNGMFNVAASMWLITTPTISWPSTQDAIRTEFMVWTQIQPTNLSAGTSVKVATTVIDGRTWEVWTNTRWGSNEAGQPLSWRYLAYYTPQNTQTISYDARKLLQDAINRGLVSPSLYIANFELGNEVFAGAGTTWIRNLSIGF